MVPKSAAVMGVIVAVGVSAALMQLSQSDQTPFFFSLSVRQIVLHCRHDAHGLDAGIVGIPIADGELPAKGGQARELYKDLFQKPGREEEDSLSRVDRRHPCRSYRPHSIVPDCDDHRRTQCC